MFKPMDKKIIAVLRLKFLHNWPFALRVKKSSAPSTNVRLFSLHDIIYQSTCVSYGCVETQRQNGKEGKP